MALSVCVALAAFSSATADQTLSGSYKGTITYTPKGSVTSYDDSDATMSILPDAGMGPVAVVTYSDQLGRYRENCSVTYNTDGTITLKGTSYTILSGASFSPDTFTIRIGADGEGIRRLGRHQRRKDGSLPPPLAMIAFGRGHKVEPVTVKRFIMIGARFISSFAPRRYTT